MNSPLKKDFPFFQNEPRDISSDPTITGNYYEGGTIPANQRGSRQYIPSVPSKAAELFPMSATSEPYFQKVSSDLITGAASTAGPGLLSGLSGKLGSFGAGPGGKLSSSQQMGIIGGVMGVAQGLIGRKKRRSQQRKAKDEYNTRRTEFENLDTSNLAAGFENSYANLENTFEDLTVNQQQAQFESQQNARSQANIMQNLRGAAGASGVGGLAQALANQSQVANQRASASIGIQESANQRAAAQGASRIQQLEAGGDQFAQQQRLAGANTARSLQADKTGTLLGMAQADKAAADQAIQESNAALFGGIGQLAGVALTGGASAMLPKL